MSKKKVVMKPANNAKSIHQFVFCLLFIVPYKLDNYEPEISGFESTKAILKFDAVRKPRENCETAEKSRPRPLFHSIFTGKSDIVSVEIR